MPQKAITRSLLAPALAAAAVAFSVGSTIATRTQWFPDTPHYAVRTLEILGRNHGEAKAEAAPFLASRGGGLNVNVVDTPGAPLFHPRILYPLLSAPFVAIFGLRGMLAVPFVASIAFCAILWRLVARRAPPWTAALIVALVANARSFSVYSVAALTDGGALALIGAMLLTLPGEERANGVPKLTFLAAVAAGFTREVGPLAILLGFACLLWARNKSPEVKAGWRATAAALFAAGAVTMVWVAAIARLDPLSQIELMTHRTGASALGALPRVAGRVLADTGIALLRDWPLAIVLGAAAWGAVRRRGSIEAWLAAAALAASLALLAINPTDTKFRLQLPIVPFAAMLASPVIGTIRPGRMSDAPV
jgi:hypothetical protein